MFFFAHDNAQPNESSRPEFLAFVEVMKDHSAASYDPSIPVVKMNKSIQQQLRENRDRTCFDKVTYAVINVNDIVHQVGLMQSSIDSLDYKVIAPYYLFKNNIRSTAGDVRRL